MFYSYDRRTAATDYSEGGKLWKDVEDFLYPPWYKGSGYRGDIEYTVYVRLLEEFYQWPERMSEDDKESVPDALARVKAEDDRQWKERRQDALEIIRALPGGFRPSDVSRHVYRSTLDRLVYEGVLELHGGSIYSLASGHRA